jgi:hypothetical protein
MIERQREDRLRPDLEALRPKEAPIYPRGIGEPGQEFTRNFTRKFTKTELQALGYAGLAGSDLLPDGLTPERLDFSEVHHRLDFEGKHTGQSNATWIPPDKQPQAIETPLKQTELLAENKQKNKA